MVNFSIFPHLEHPDMPSNTLAHAERWAREIGHESYAMDDQSAITVIHGESRVISEGAWRHFES
ncbi:MAG: hypothetical protein V9G04_06725 [Nocardioides sp.]